MNRLTVSDVERLAKAGVAMQWRDIEHAVVRDEEVPSPIQYTMPAPSLGEGLMDRWYRTPAGQRSKFDGFCTPFHLAAAEHGGKVYVFVYGANKEPTVLEDDVHLYPSDALLAKLQIYLEHGK